MAFTVETAVISATAFSILLHSLALALPLAEELRMSSETIGESNVEETESTSEFYKERLFAWKDKEIPLLKISPQRSVEICSLAGDIAGKLKKETG